MARLTALLLLLLLVGLVHLVEEAQAGGLELVSLLLEVLGGSGALASLALGNELAERSDLLTDLVGLGLVQTVLELLESLLCVVQHTVGTVGSLDGGLALLVLSTILLSVFDHGLDLALRETRAGSDRDRLVLVRGLVLGTDVDDRVGVNVEGDLNLRNTTVSRRDTNKLEVTEKLVVANELTLTLVYLDLDSSLKVGCGREGLGLLGGDGGVAVNQTSEDTTEGFDTERQGSDIEQQDIGDFTSQDSTLDGSTNGNSLIRVDRLSGVTAKHALDRVGDLGHTSHTTNQDDILDLAGLKVGVLEGLTDRLDSAAKEGLNETLELSTSHLQVDVLSTRGISGDERKVDLGLEGRRKLNLGLLGSLTDTLDGHAVTGEVNSGLLLELLDNVTNKADVKVLTTYTKLA